MEISYASERLNSKLFDELVPLIAGHHLEISRFKDLELRPDWESYSKLSDAGVLRTYTARDNGKLVGYAIFVVQKHPHFSGSTQASEDLLYLEPSMRLGRIGLDFLKWCDQELVSQDKVSVIYREREHTSTTTDQSSCEWGTRPWT